MGTIIGGNIGTGVGVAVRFASGVLGGVSVGDTVKVGRTVSVAGGGKVFVTGGGVNVAVAGIPVAVFVATGGVGVSVAILGVCVGLAGNGVLVSAGMVAVALSGAAVREGVGVKLSRANIVACELVDTPTCLARLL